MTIRKIHEIIEHHKHPLEEHFNIPTCSTEIVTSKRETVLVSNEMYDGKDSEIEKDYQEIADTAMDLVTQISTLIHTAEPKFLARLAEVAGQNLNTALAAVDKKAKLKQHKDNYKLRQDKATNGKTINNNLIINREDLLAMMQADATKKPATGEDEIIDATYAEVKKLEESTDD